MGDYNQLKKQAMERIDKLVNTNKLSKEDIYFIVLKEFGIGRRFVNYYIELCISRGIISEKDHILITPIIEKHGNN